MTDAARGYRTFTRLADRILLRGSDQLSLEDVQALHASLGETAPGGALEALRSLYRAMPKARSEERLRLFTRALAGVRQAYLMECRTERVRTRRVARSPLSENVVVEVSEEDLSTSLSPDILAGSQVHRFKALTLLLKSPIFNQLSREKLFPLLTNSDLTMAVLSLLRKVKPEKRLVFARDLLGRANLYLRRAALALVRDLPMERRAPLLVLALADRDLNARATRELLEEPSEAFSHLSSAVLDPDHPHRVHVLKVMRRFRLAKSRDVVGTLVDAADPDVCFWARLTLHAAGSSQANYLREMAAAPDQHQKRVYAKLELINDGVLRESQLVAELKNSSQIAHLYAAEAIAELPDFPKQLSTLVATLQRSGDREARLQAIQKLSLFNDPRLVELFQEGARDPHPPVRKRAVSRLVALRGYEALEEHFDLEPMLHTPYGELTVSEQQYILFHVLPLIPMAPDVRFAPYLVSLTADTCEGGIDLQFELNLKPILLEFGEPLMGELDRLALARNPHLSSIGEELLLRMRLPGARDMVERSRSAGDPIQIAFRNLYNKSLKEQARRELAAAGRRALQTLLPGLEDPRIQDDVFWILGRIREPETVPRLVALLGEANDHPGDSTGAPPFLAGPLTQCLVSYGDLAFPALRDALAGESWSVRCHAAHVLGRARDHDAAGLLTGLLRDSSEEVVMTALGALGSLMDEELIPAIAAMLFTDSDRVVHASVLALTEINSKKALPYLERAVGQTRGLGLKRLMQNAMVRIRESGSETVHGERSGLLTLGIKSLFGAR